MDELVKMNLTCGETQHVAKDREPCRELFVTMLTQGMKRIQLVSALITQQVT